MDSRTRMQPLEAGLGFKTISDAVMMHAVKVRQRHRRQRAELLPAQLRGNFCKSILRFQLHFYSLIGRWLQVGYKLLCST